MYVFGDVGGGGGGGGRIGLTKVSDSFNRERHATIGYVSDMARWRGTFVFLLSIRT